MSETESFGQVMAEMADKVASPYWTDMAERLKRAHDREIRDTAQQEYDRGYNAGQHSMDAEHRAVAMRLRALPLDGGSHENLSQIARAIYHSDFGWTQGACAALRDELVRLMGGVSDDTAEPMTTDEFIEYVEEDTRRLKGDASKAGDGDDACGSQCCGACAAGDGGDSGEQVEVTDERLADDCAADSRGGDGGGDLHMAGVRITDELREWMSTVLTSDDHAWAIADRIDAQFDRICAQQEAVLQSTIAELAEQCDEAREERDELMKQRAEMTAELARRLKERDAARARTDELSDELLRTRRERDETRDECDRLKRDMLDEWVPRTSYEEKVEKYRRAYMESDAWRKSLQEKLNAMRDAITAALDG